MPVLRVAAPVPSKLTLAVIFVSAVLRDTSEVRGAVEWASEIVVIG